MVKKMEKEKFSLLMVQDLKVNGNLTNQMDMEKWYIKMVIFMKVISLVA